MCQFDQNPEYHEFDPVSEAPEPMNEPEILLFEPEPEFDDQVEVGLNFFNPHT